MNPQSANLLLFAVLAGLFYFTLIRPQRKRAMEHREMLAALAPGDEVVTVGGVYAIVVSIEERVKARLLGGAEIELAPQAIARVVTGADGAESGIEVNAGSETEQVADDEHGR
jgi:preprotein translocase subunit YajC